MVLKSNINTRERDRFTTDLENKTCSRIVTGTTLKDHFDLINSQGFLDGEVYDAFLCEQTADSKIRTFYFFLLGEEQFHIPLTTTSGEEEETVGIVSANKLQPEAEIINIAFSEAENHQRDPIGTTVGSFLAIGDSSIVFSIEQDLNDSFEIFDSNKIRNTKLLLQGTYDIFIKAAGLNSNHIDKITITIGAPGEIHNITLSNLSVDAGAPIGSTIGVLGITGGAPPASFVITNDPDDVFDIGGIDGNLLITTAAMVLGQQHDVTIQATDQNNSTRLGSFTIEVVASTFADTWSLDQNGADEYETTPDDVSLRFTNKMSAHIWLNPNAGGNREFLAKWNAFTNNAAYAMRLSATNIFTVFISGNGSTSQNLTGGAIANGAWVSLGYTFNAGFLKLYVDGLPVNSGNLAGIASIFGGNAEFTLGSRIDGTGARSNYYDGLINEGSVYDTDLTDAQMLELGGALPKNPKILSSATNLISWWQQGEFFSGSVDPDEQGANNLNGVNMNNSNRNTDVPV